MNFLYLDPGLLNNVGHHSFSCRHITGETKARGIPTYILSNVGIEPDLKRELGAQPFFECYTYTTYSPHPDGKVDPICGWLNDFEVAWSRTRGDLEKIKGASSADIVYLNSARAPQLMAIWHWFTQIPLPQRPTIVVEFGNVINASVEGGKVTSVPHPMVDSMPMLLRYIAGKFTKEDRARLILATFDASVSKAFEAVLDYPVQTLPLPQEPITDCHSRVGKRPITVSLLGQQGGAKGFHMAPQIASTLLATRSDIRLLIHNSLPQMMHEEQESLRALAAADSRLTLHEELADRELWRQLLHQSDLILCPYHQPTYSASYSAVASEAVANAIPSVVPANTTLSELLVEFGNPGVTFEEFAAESVLQAVNQALDNFNRLAEAANVAASQWGKVKGASNLVDAILGFRNPR
jgi:hypothetical protein